MKAHHFHDRFVESLRCRLYPNTNLHLKQLADAVGRSESSIARWWRGEARILAEDLERIALYFADRGDRSFLGAIFPEALFETALEADRNKLEQLLRTALSSLSPTNESAPGETWHWITAEGAVLQAPLGHTEYVARTLRLPPSVGNLIRYATEILGWIAVTVDTSGVVTVRHDGRRVAPLALESLCEWLTRRCNYAPTVSRLVQIDGTWTEARHDSVELAVNALQTVASIVRKPRHPWSVKRLPLDAIKNERLGLLLKSYNEAPEQVIHKAAAMGALTDSNILSVDGENVTSLFIPPKYLLSRQSIEGQNIMSVPDTDYAMMVRSRVLKTKQEGPVYYELKGTLNNEYLHYLNLAIPEPGPRGKVLTSTVVLKHQIFV